MLAAGRCSDVLRERERGRDVDAFVTVQTYKTLGAISLSGHRCVRVVTVLESVRGARYACT
jgi:hypothetical protein